VIGRRPRDGEHRGDGVGGAGPEDGVRRVRGAWTTPAVVVRGPDGEVVAPAAADARSAAGTPAATAPPLRRPRPRRIPGAPGAVLVSPTLLRDAADSRDDRRRRRQEAPAARVYPLPPRRTPDPAGDRHPATPPAAGDDEHDGAAERGWRRPSLRQVAEAGGAASRAGRGAISGRGARRPTPSRPGERRRGRVLGAVASLSFDRLLPGDEEARERRNQRLRRLGTRVGSAALAVVVVYSVFPVRTYLNQRAATDRAREQLEVFQEENERLEERARDLRDDDTIEQKAREDLGLVMPGEESYGILPAPRAGDPVPDPAPTTTTAPPGG